MLLCELSVGRCLSFVKGIKLFFTENIYRLIYFNIFVYFSGQSSIRNCVVRKQFKKKFDKTRNEKIQISENRE